ncbi:hypothetical protein C8J57DRAFT_1307672, partial [Mycena rebaudengoi]
MLLKILFSSHLQSPTSPGWPSPRVAGLQGIYHPPKVFESLPARGIEPEAGNKEARFFQAEHDKHFQRDDTHLSASASPPSASTAIRIHSPGSAIHRRAQPVRPTALPAMRCPPPSRTRISSIHYSADRLLIGKRGPGSRGPQTRVSSTLSLFSIPLCRRASAYRDREQVRTAGLVLRRSARPPGARLSLSV